MAGKWIKTKPHPHDCDPFGNIDRDDDYGSGSEWKCECGQVWILESNGPKGYRSSSFTRKGKFR